MSHTMGQRLHLCLRVSVMQRWCACGRPDALEAETASWLVPWLANRLEPLGARAEAGQLPARERRGPVGWGIHLAQLGTSHLAFVFEARGMCLREVVPMAVVESSSLDIGCDLLLMLSAPLRCWVVPWLPRPARQAFHLVLVAERNMSRHLQSHCMPRRRDSLVAQPRCLINRKGALQRL